MFHSSHNDIAGKVEADFIYVFYFAVVYFTKLAISRTLTKYDGFVYEW